MTAEKLYKIDKWKLFDMIGYKPHAKQVLFHRSEARFKIPVCGRRFGKTAMGARELEPVLMTPNRRVWIVGPTYDLGEKEFRVIWHDMLIKLGLGKEKEVRRSYTKKQGNLSIEFPWNTSIEVRSAERAENLVGEGLDYVIMSEAAKHTNETWERFIRPALTDRRGRATFSTTPEGQNWIYALWQRGRDPKEKNYDSWQFPSWDNPYVYPGGRQDEEILETERSTSTEVFQQEYAADFTSFSGKIFTEWDEQSHVTDVKFNPMFPNYIAFDWGFAAPMAAIEFQVDPWGRVRVWREHYKARTRLSDFLDQLRNRSQPAGYRLDLCFGDAADPEAVVTVSEKFHACYADPRSKSGSNDGTLQSGWREGVELVQGLLKLQETDKIDENDMPMYEPWLVVDHSCINLIHEFNNYRIVDSSKNRDPREAAQSKDDHALDALRYGCMHIFKLGATQRLSEVVDRNSFTEVPATGYFTSEKSFS